MEEQHRKPYVEPEPEQESEQESEKVETKSEEKNLSVKDSIEKIEEVEKFEKNERDKIPEHDRPKTKTEVMDEMARAWEDHSDNFFKKSSFVVDDMEAYIDFTRFDNDLLQDY